MYLGNTPPFPLVLPCMKFKWTCMHIYRIFILNLEYVALSTIDIVHVFPVHVY